MVDTSEAERRRRELNARRVAVVNDLLFETPGGTRYTQDSPILPNIWLAYATRPRDQLELILNVDFDHNAGDAARSIAEKLKAFRKDAIPLVDEHAEDRPAGKVHQGRRPARLSAMPGQIAAKLYFDELIAIVLPMTGWWADLKRRLADAMSTYDRRQDPKPNPGQRAVWRPFPGGPGGARPGPDDEMWKQIHEALMLMRRELLPKEIREGDSLDAVTARAIEKDRKKLLDHIPDDLAWLVRIAGWIGYSMWKNRLLLSDEDDIGKALEQDIALSKHDRIEKAKEKANRIKKVNLERIAAARAHMVEGFFWLFSGWQDAKDKPAIHRVNKNRRVHLAVQESALTIKADAARRLFNIDCSRIAWAIIDSGVDGKHPAFRNTSAKHEMDVRKRLWKAEDEKRRTKKENAKDADASGSSETDAFADELPLDELESRVIQTLDFTYLRELLEINLGEYGDEPDPDYREVLLDRMTRNIAASKGQPILCRDDLRRRRRAARTRSDDEAAKQLGEIEAQIDRFRTELTEGRLLSWRQLEKMIVEPCPERPENDHGTHVAGILGADWIEDVDTEIKQSLALRTRRMVGVCPDIKLIDVRVFREDGLTDEFELMAAIQFLRWMNSRAGYMKVHGANLSLSLVHEVRRFACGQTPICIECNEASAAGMVIVAAAGNRGFDFEDIEEVRPSDGYRTVSVTDPGNADAVITVGATHRKKPHEYGVSYFSSRGPTGDGRVKPDVVAPGEKIDGPVPDGLSAVKDGTSMAAPHVSGVAAMLMARHSELVANPARVKKIICQTATDLGRERYFQGSGLVDALRALQSV